MTLCWFHHHVAIHQLGYTIDPESPVHRRRLLSPRQTTGPPLRDRYPHLAIITTAA